MNTILLIILSAVIGYLLGSANSSLIVGIFFGVDVRQHGSGNAGMTNVLRTIGKTAALLVLAGDVLKGVLSCLIGSYLAGDIGLIIGGTAAVIGHNWPVYFGFRGGKGALTSIAVVFMMDWKIALIILGIFLITVAATRFVSLGSILGSAAFPIISIIFEKSAVFIAFAAVIGILAIARHHSNIGRLLKGTESKLGVKK